MAISEQLAALMREATKDRSQRQLAVAADVSQATIGNMLMGRVPSKSIAESPAVKTAPGKKI